MGINGRYLLVDSVIVTKSASQENCWLKWGNLLADLVTGHQICQSANMLTDMVEGVNLLADLVTVSISATSQEMNAGRNWVVGLIC